MSVVEGRTDLWRSLAGRGPDGPLPVEPGLWQAVADRLNPAKARPRLREGVETIPHASARGGVYAMLASPDRLAAYVRLAPEEVALTHLMDGSRTVAQLVGAFARDTGRLAPDQVTRVVADLAGARMLEELPVDAFAPIARLGRRAWPARVGRGLLAFASGRRVVLANPDRVAGLAYRAGGRLLFTRVGAVAMAVVSVWGLGLFVRTWMGGARQAVVAGGSYGRGALVLLGLNVLGLLVHESGHALGVKHAGRRTPAVGVMCYFGIPSAYVDTTDMWMADRRRRLIATAAGPGFAITFAGAIQVLAQWHPDLASVAFPLGFAWYLNSLFNLNPLMALDGYYLVMDWLEVPNLRPRAVALIAGAVRRPALIRAERHGEDRLVARYAVLSLLWLVAFTAVMSRVYKDRISGAVAGLWHTGIGGRALVVGLVALLVSPVAYGVLSWLGRRPAVAAEAYRRRRRTGDEPRRLEALRASRLGGLPPEALHGLAAESRWLPVRRGAEVIAAGAAAPGVVVVADGAVEGRRPGDPSGFLRRRAEAGDLIGVGSVLAGRPSSLSWTAVGTRLLLVPGPAFSAAVGAHPPSDEVDLAEIETLLESTPALSGMAPEDRAALAATLTAVDLAPGKRFRLSGEHVALVGAGVVRTDDGGEVRAGGIVGPPGDEPVEAIARSRARVWPFEVSGALAQQVASAVAGLASHGSSAPSSGMHGDHYAPLVLPWGTPPPTDPDGEETDRRFRRLLLWLLLLAALLVWMAIPAGTVWAETPTDTAVLEVTAGTVDVVIGSEDRVLDEGDRILLRAGDRVAPRRRSTGSLTFRGGAEALVCPRAAVAIGTLRSSARELPIRPTAELRLDRGRILVATASTSADFAPLGLVAALADERVVTNRGEATFAVGTTQVLVEAGVVASGRRIVAPTGERPTCGVGRGSSGAGSDDGNGSGQSDDGGGDDGGGGITTTTVDGATTSTTGPDSTTTTAPGGSTTTVPTGSSSTTVPAVTTTTTAPPPTTTTTTASPDAPPRILRFLASPGGISQANRTGACGSPTTTQVLAEVRDDDDPPSTLGVRFTYVLDGDPSVTGTVTMVPSGGTFVATLGPFAQGTVPAAGGTFTLTASAADPGGNQAAPVTTTVSLARC